MCPPWDDTYYVFGIYNENKHLTHTLQAKCGTFTFLLCSLVPRQLPRVVDIVPKAVETSCYRGDGVEEGVGHPDGEGRVLLP